MCTDAAPGKNGGSVRETFGFQIHCADGDEAR